MKPTQAQAQHFIDSCLGLAASRWDRPLFRKAAIAGYAAAEKNSWRKYQRVGKKTKSF